MSKIVDLAEQVRAENQVCGTLLGNGLDIIACCLRTLACDPGPNSYGPDASIPESKSVVLSLDLRA